MNKHSWYMWLLYNGEKSQLHSSDVFYFNSHLFTLTHTCFHFLRFVYPSILTIFNFFIVWFLVQTHFECWKHSMQNWILPFLMTLNIWLTVFARLLTLPLDCIKLFNAKLEPSVFSWELIFDSVFARFLYTLPSDCIKLSIQN